MEWNLRNHTQSFMSSLQAYSSCLLDPDQTMSRVCLHWRQRISQRCQSIMVHGASHSNVTPAWSWNGAGRCIACQGQLCLITPEAEADHPSTALSKPVALRSGPNAVCDPRVAVVRSESRGAACGMTARGDEGVWVLRQATGPAAPIQFHDHARCCSC